jgi:rhamnopyranosyl-N-acetylglucosaminyl-diphospho-decaprenol beta-1,3/1,4-galactofuranosyltransferase
MLRRCLEAVLAQTRQPDTILVVNNASTDGTAEMLAAEYPQVQSLNLRENLGGAGGYYYGLEWATAQNFDWMSVMDDDGYPASDCLERLLYYPDPTLAVRGALVLDQADPSSLAFEMHVVNPPVTTIEQVETVGSEGVIRDYINPFNGVLIARNVVQEIGLPEKDFFFWGDEYEYFLRMKQAKIPMAIVTTAQFFHPANRMQPHKVRLVFKEFPVYYANDPLRDYLIVRNHGYIVKKYRGWIGWLAHLLRYLIFYQKISKPRGVSDVLTAAWHGARADFSHHRRFLV